MAWQTNPDISATTSSASTLNGWRSNAEFLYDRTPTVNPPFSALYLQAVESIDFDDTIWTIVNRHPYLHVSIIIYDTLDGSGLRVYKDDVDSSPTWSTTNLSDGGVLYTGVVDVSGYSPGDTYEMYVKADWTGTGDVIVNYMMEYDSATFYG